MRASSRFIRAGLPRILLAMAGAFCTLAPLASALAQPEDGYIGPELSSEPAAPGMQKGGRYGGGYEGDWTFCAGERERCSVRGWGVVRYGTDGRYFYREVRNATLRCDNSMFGDPYRGRSKQCEVRYYGGGDWGGGGSGGGDYGWMRCASEGRVCRFGGGYALVRYGADGRFYEREVRGNQVMCSNQSFGDPAPGRSKYCEVRSVGDGGWQGGGGSGGGGWQGGGEGWQYCASEDGYCNLPGRATVRFGADGRFYEQSYRGGSVACSVREFGDPARGKKKHCEFRLDGGGGWGGGGGMGGGVGSGRFEYCANEDGYCDFRGMRLVRFGTDGRFVTGEFRGGVECSLRAFGEDPAPRRKKHCEVEVR